MIFRSNANVFCFFPVHLDISNVAMLRTKVCSCCNSWGCQNSVLRVFSPLYTLSDDILEREFAHFVIAPLDISNMFTCRERTHCFISRGYFEYCFCKFFCRYNHRNGFRVLHHGIWEQRKHFLFRCC